MAHHGSNRATFASGAIGSLQPIGRSLFDTGPVVLGQGAVRFVSNLRYCDSLAAIPSAPCRACATMISCTI